MNRPSDRNRGSRNRPSGFRAPPPPGTGREAGFYEDTISSGARVVLALADGSTVRGVLKEFDRDQMTIEAESGSIVVRKSTIRYLSED